MREELFFAFEALFLAIAFDFHLYEILLNPSFHKPVRISHQQLLLMLLSAQLKLDLQKFYLFLLPAKQVI